MKKINSFMIAILVISILFSMSCAGCLGNRETGNAKDDSVSNNDKTAETSAKVEESFDPFGKYDPPIEITTVRIVDDTYKYEEGDSLESNVWTKAFEQELGIKFKYDWIASGWEQGNQKMTVTIASGSIPDLIPVDHTQLAQLANADLLEDLNDVYDKYAAPLTKEIMTQEGSAFFDACTFNGKLMAMTKTDSITDNADILYIRADWLKRLGLEPPKTMDDVLKISEAFTTQDPDGNNKDDTIGLAVTKTLYGGFAGLWGFFNGYHAYPECWIEDDTGKLVYGSIQYEMKEGLEVLNRLYKTGQLDREFGVKEGGKVGETIAAGKCGMYYGKMWTPIWPVQSSYDNDNNADWTAYPIVSADNKTARPQVKLPIGTCYAMKKGAQNPEAVVKLVNLFIEKGWGETADQLKYFTNENGTEIFKYPLTQAWPARRNLNAHLNIKKVFNGADISILNPEELTIYNKIVKYREGEGTHWCSEKVFGPTGSFSVIDKYVKENLAEIDKFYGAPTPTQAEKSSTLYKMEIEVFTKIIMGEALLDEFDKFVSDWKKTGGDDITKEINEWYNEKE